MTKTQRIFASISLTLVALAFTGCGSSGSSSTSTSTSGGGGSSEAASAATGDIPDNQVFLTFHNIESGYSIRYPEGWTQKGTGNDLTFSDKGNSSHIVVASGSPADIASVKSDLTKLSQTDSTVKAQVPVAVSLNNGRAIKVTYEALGPPDSVTGKRLPLTVDRYVYSRNGKVATLDLGTVQGVDNVDAYRLISESFSWK